MKSYYKEQQWLEKEMTDYTHFFSNILALQEYSLWYFSLILNCISDFVEKADKAVNWLMLHISQT